MKKGIFFLILIGCIGLFLWNHPKKYQITYSIQNYRIQESFEKKKDFFFLIQKDKKKFVYSLEKTKKVRKKQIQEIKEYQRNQLLCILPIYTKEEKHLVYCNLGGEQVSLDYLIKTSQEDFLTLQEEIKKDQGILPKEYETKQKKDNIESYPKNMKEEDVYILWNYKGIDTIEKEKVESISFLEEDMYDNIMATIVGNYYILFDNRSVNGIQEIYVYDFVKKKKFVYPLKKPLSKDSYINGVVEDFVYLTDTKKKKQVRISILKKKEEEIDQNGTIFIRYENGEKKEYSKSDFFMQEQYFEEDWIEGKYRYDLVENKIYQTYKKAQQYPVLVLELENITEYQVQQNELLVLQEDTLYHYDEIEGLRKILTSPELKYNYQNIYQLGKK